MPQIPSTVSLGCQNEKGEPQDTALVTQKIFRISNGLQQTGEKVEVKSVPKSR